MTVPERKAEAGTSSGAGPAEAAQERIAIPEGSALKASETQPSAISTTQSDHPYAPAPTAPRRRRSSRLAFEAFLMYTGASITIWALPILTRLRVVCVGVCGSDSKLYMWSIRWMAYALGHRLDPLYSHVIWAPQGVNLTWVTTIPGPSFAVTPITALFGPLFSLNLLMIAAPALAAWASYLVCVQVTRRFWPSVAGGFVFGFSTYMVQHMRAQVNLLLVFCVPLAVYLVIRRLNGSIGRLTFTALLTLALVGQFSVSTELFATMTFFAGIALLGSVVLGRPQVRKPLLSTIPLIGSAYVATAVIVSPFLVKALTDIPPHQVRPLDLNSADLLSFILPRKTMLFGGATFNDVTRHFLAYGRDDTAYIGPAILFLLVLFAWEGRRNRSTWLLLGFVALVGILAMGPTIHIDGRPGIALPETLVTRVPLLQQSLPERYPMYLSLGVSLIAAIWLSRGVGRRALLRYGLVGLGAISFLPNLSAAGYDQPPDVPPFFSTDAYQRYLRPDETIFAIAQERGDELAWQSAADMSIRLARAYVGPLHPTSGAQLKVVLSIPKAGVPDPFDLAAFIRGRGVGAVVVQEPVPELLRAVLDQTLGQPTAEVGGVAVYEVPPGGPTP